MRRTMVLLLRRDKEIRLNEAHAELLSCTSAAAIDRRLAHERAKIVSRGRSQAKTEKLLKVVEIDLVGHEGGTPPESTATPSVTDIATGWCDRSVKKKAAK